MRTSRANFTDRQKAEIYARDRALCSYSGKSLWLLDYGAAPALIDHVDHWVVASKGGDASLDNGVLCNFLHNYIRGEQRPPLRLFDGGLPNLDAFWLLGRMPPEILEHIDRFAVLQPSDWYFNRAVGQLRVAAAMVYRPKRVDGKDLVRGLDYRCRAAVKRLKEWRSVSAAEGTSSLSDRDLLPRRPRPDHELVMQIQAVVTEKELAGLARTLAPFLKASYDAVESILKVGTDEDAQRYIREVGKNRYVVEPVKTAMIEYMSAISASNRKHFGS